MKTPPDNHAHHCLDITTGVFCKNNCSYCPQATLKEAYKGERMLSLQGFKKILENVPIDIRLRFAGFSEPFINPECADMIIYAISKGYHTAVYTTLKDFRDSDYEKIKDLDFEFFRVHDIGQPKRDYKFIDDWSSAKPNNRANLLPFNKMERKKFVRGCSHTIDYHDNIMLPNGDVVICCQDWKLEYILGNLYETHYDKLNREWDKEKCHYCTYAI